MLPELMPAFELERFSNRTKPMPKHAICGAQTRQNVPCKRKALANGRCRNHGGLSTGPKSAEGRKRIAEAQPNRWARWRSERSLKVLKLQGASFGKRLAGLGASDAA